MIIKDIAIVMTFILAKKMKKNSVFLENMISASGNVLVRFTRNVPNTENFKLYFDNYYSSIPLIEYLHSKNIHSIGTVRLIRLPYCPLSEKNLEKKEMRGFERIYYFI